MGGGEQKVHNWMDRCFFSFQMVWLSRGCGKKLAVVYVVVWEIMSHDRCARVRQALNASCRKNMGDKGGRSWGREVGGGGQ